MKVFCCCRYTAEDGDQDYAEADYAEAAIQAADLIMQKLLYKLQIRHVV
jgi:hypothetical protein